MAEQRFCKKCGKTMKEGEFYTSKNIEKYPPDGKMNICKKCLTMHVDNWDPETYKWILQELDVPYIKKEWDVLLEKYGKDPKKITGVTIIGRYLSKMKLKQWKDYTWADTDQLAEKELLLRVNSMRAQGMSADEIEAELAVDHTPPKPKELLAAQQPDGVPEYEDPSTIKDKFSDQLTEEDKLMLRLKWGRGYGAEEWVRMEQLYRDMMESYDIQSAGHKDTLIMLCKASLKTNQLLDAGDVESAQKMAKVYDSLMRSGKFTAAQNKEESNDDVDSIGQIVAICERDGFIPRYYQAGPADHVDRVIQDMQQYTHDLVTEELGLGNLIENSIKTLEKERAAIEDAAHDNRSADQKLEEELFDYDTPIVSDQDFAEFVEFKDKEAEEDGEWT